MNFNYDTINLLHLDEISSFLKDNNITYTTDRNNFMFDYANGSGRTFEIEYVPTNAVNIKYPKYGITGVDQNYFSKLSVDAENNNSFKFWVKQFEWENLVKQEILKSYILHAAGKTPTKFYARDTEVVVLSNKDVKEFEETNCFYGYRSSSLSLGLVLKKDKGNYTKGTLLMVYTFGKNFFGKKDDVLEIFRVGTINYCQVVGGSSKLCKHFLDNYKTLVIGNKIVSYTKLVYYVDYDHGIGSSVDHLGFKFVRYSGGGFMNYDLIKNTITHRSPMKHKEIMARVALGEIIAIPNSGVKVYELTV